MLSKTKLFLSSLVGLAFFSGSANAYTLQTADFQALIDTVTANVAIIVPAMLGLAAITWAAVAAFKTVKTFFKSAV